jgi:23S rRNA pseudouridine1911/1915/1917 synthase
VTGHLAPVGPDEEGDRLDRVIADRLGVSRSQAAGRISAGRVRVDGRTADKSHRVAVGQTLEVEPEPDVEHVAPPLPPVRYADDHLLVVSKPAGLVVHPGAGTPTGTLVQALEAAGVPLAPSDDPVRPGIVHRLDKETSGLLVIAKTAEARSGLVEALARHDVERRYLALVEGRLPTTRGRVDAPIGRDPTDRKRFACVEGGKRAVTHWEVRREGAVGDVVVSLVSCRLETGRTHQIRVHLSHAGHPVVGDRRYGARRDLPTQLGLTRFALHAHELAFDHPVTGERVTVTEDLPDDLAHALAGAGLAP